MTFEEVLPFLKKGKKIYNSGWATISYIHFDNFGDLISNDGEPWSLDLDDLCCLYWEIGEECNKKQSTCMSVDEFKIYFNDIKNTISNLQERINNLEIK